MRVRRWRRGGTTSAAEQALQAEARRGAWRLGGRGVDVHEHRSRRVENHTAVAVPCQQRVGRTARGRDLFDDLLADGAIAVRVAARQIEPLRYALFERAEPLPRPSLRVAGARFRPAPRKQMELAAIGVPHVAFAANPELRYFHRPSCTARTWGVGRVFRPGTSVDSRAGRVSRRDYARNPRRCSTVS